MTFVNAFPSLSAGAVVLTTSTGDGSSSGLSYGQQFLRSWFAQVGKMLNTYTGSVDFSEEQGVIAVIGDSWTNGDHRLTGPLRAKAQTEYGAGGVGWVTACIGDGLSSLPSGANCVPSGTWTYRNHGTTPRGRGVDLFEALSLDETPTVGTLTYTATFTDAVIHYLKQTNGGTFRYQVDSDGWNSVDTSNAADLFATVAITGKSSASHTLVIEVVTAGAAGVVLFGVDFQITGDHGVRVHKLGATGSKSTAWETLPDETTWTASLVALAPHLAIICLGTNDDIGDVVPATYRTAIEALIVRIRSGLPLVDILLLSPADNGNAVGTYSVSDYTDELRASALANDYAFFDAYMLLGDYADADARDLYANVSHINEAGGQVIMSRLWREMLLL